MSLLKRMFGGERDLPRPRSAHRTETTDEQALDRYRHLLRTAHPETVETAHAEAFVALTPEQRRQVRAQLAAAVPDAERATSDDPDVLAQAATRAEMRQPGTLERSFGALDAGGTGPGNRLGGSLLAAVAAAYGRTSVAAALHDNPPGSETVPAETGHE